jgi:ABC-type antimicrobial peptide transport system permease subunit
MDAGKTGFDSEIWGDADQLMQAFRRPVYSSVIVKLNDPEGFSEFKHRIEADPRLTLEAKQENAFYAEQSKLLANFIRYLGLILSIIFSIGAIIGAMITMYASVAHRTAEIGTLRALGFRRATILLTFLIEALMLGLAGGLAGLLLASFIHELAVLLRTRIPLYPEWRHYRQVLGVCPGNGGRGWLSSRCPRRAAGYCGFTASGIDDMTVQSVLHWIIRGRRCWEPPHHMPLSLRSFRPMRYGAPIVPMWKPKAPSRRSMK